MNNIFGSNYSTSNPFNMNGYGNNSSIDDNLFQSFAKLEELKAKQAQLNNLQNQANSVNQQNGRQTVYTDISNELSGLSEEEINFIVSSQEYQDANAKYQNDFSQFLVSKFANEYLQKGNTRSLEEMLYVIRKQKEKYQDRYAEDISQIKTQNQELMSKNDQLAESNQALQKQLAEIQKQLAKKKE